MTGDQPPALLRFTLTAEEVVRRIASECAYVDHSGRVGIRLQPAIALIRLYGEQFRPPTRKGRPRSPKPPTLF